MAMAKAKKKKTSAAKKMTAAKKRSTGKRKGKLTAKGRAKIAAASRARWRARKGAGTKKSHIPLKVLKKNHASLGALISRREKSGGWA
jgi:hypothetical protein